MTAARVRRLVIVGLIVCLPAGALAQTPAPPEEPKSPPSSPQEPPPPSDKPKPAPEPAPKPWWERMTFFGDFRARYEGFFQDGLETRQRERFRFRIGMRTPITDEINLNLRLASGDAEDVTSTNQSLTDFLNRKPINIDQISLAYTPSAFKRLTLGVGKYAMPVTRTQMVWDDDVNWEGTYQTLSLATGGPVAVRLVGVQSPINEVGGGEDAFMFGQYAQVNVKAGRHDIQLSLADYAFRNADQIAVALDRREVIRAQNTNALRRDAAGRVVGFQSGFNLVDAIAQATIDTGRAQYPLVALADFVVNTKAAGGEDTGVWLNATYGRAATPKTFLAGYTFARVERDAVLSGYNYSDMGPATNVVMNLLNFSYMPKSRVNLDAIVILTRLLRPPVPDRNPLLKRIQIDARVTF